MGIFRHLSKSLKSTLIPKSKIPIYVCEIPFFSAYGSPKGEWPAIFELNVKSGLIVFLTMSATGCSKGGNPDSTPKPSGRWGGQTSLFTRITPSVPLSAAKQGFHQ